MVVAHSYDMDEVRSCRYHSANTSPAEDTLLVRVSCWEGDIAVLVDLASGALHEIQGSERGIGRMSELAWLPDGRGLVHAGTHALGLSLIDAADPAHVVPLLDAEGQSAAGGMVLGLRLMPEGKLRFAVRPGDTLASSPGDPDLATSPGNLGMFHGDGVYELDLDSHDLRRLAQLPAAARDPKDSLYYPGSMLWAPDGSAFLALDESSGSWPLFHGGAWLGLDDGARVLDVTRVFEGVSLRDMQWSQGG